MSRTVPCVLSNFIWDTGVTNLKEPLAHAKDIAVRAIQFHLGYSCYEFEGAISTRQGQCRARYPISSGIQVLRI